jgi:hypothetical protein
VYEGDIPDIIYDIAIDSISNSVMFSTFTAFKSYPFYAQLTPKLKNVIVECILYDLHSKMIYFFNDYQNNIYAPKIFVR